MGCWTSCMVLGKLFHLPVLLFPLPSPDCLVCLSGLEVSKTGVLSPCLVSEKPSWVSVQLQLLCIAVLQLLPLTTGINAVYHTWQNQSPDNKTSLKHLILWNHREMEKPPYLYEQVWSLEGYTLLKFCCCSISCLSGLFNFIAAGFCPAQYAGKA